MSRWLVVAVVLICGCVPSNEGARLVSDRFGVCINLPGGASYSNYIQYVDYDTASLQIGGAAVEVMIGGHPRFSKESIRDVTRAVDGFTLLGEENTDGKDKLLFGINRRNHPVADFHGPENELVMFSSTDLDSIKHLLMEEGVVTDCRKSASSKQLH